MARKSLDILIVTFLIWSVVFSLGGKSNAYAATGAVRVVERKLPGAEIIATGIGYPPRRRLTLAQKRLLAQRAATVDAYRTLASTLNGISDYVLKGTGSVRVSGYVQGANITQVREYADGKVEVDLSLPVSLRGRGGGARVTWDKVISSINRQGYPVYYLKPVKKEVSEEEWLDITKKEGRL